MGIRRQQIKETLKIKRQFCNFIQSIGTSIMFLLLDIFKFLSNYLQKLLNFFWFLKVFFVNFAKFLCFLSF